MPSSTDYYGLKKPAPEDFYDVADQNGNADIVDAALHGLETGKAALGEDGKLPAALLPQLDFVPKTEKGAAGGVAQLDGTGRVPAGQLPEMNYEGPLKNAGVKAGIADGDGVVVTDSADGEKSKRVLWSTVKTALGALFRPGTWVPAWGDVTGKPSTFPPASHSHTAAQVGADAAGAAQGVQNNLNSHTGNKSNPHGVTRGQLGAVANYIVSITIPTGTWTADTGGGYYKDITVANMTATAPAKLDFAQSSDKAAGELMVSEFLSNILRIEQMAGKVRVHTYKSGKAPSVNIPVRLSWTA